MQGCLNVLRAYSMLSGLISVDDGPWLILSEPPAPSRRFIDTSMCSRCVGGLVKAGVGRGWALRFGGYHVYLVTARKIAQCTATAALALSSSLPSMAASCSARVQA